MNDIKFIPVQEFIFVKHTPDNTRRYNYTGVYIEICNSVSCNIFGDDIVKRTLLGLDDCFQWDGSRCDDLNLEMLNRYISQNKEQFLNDFEAYKKDISKYEQGNILPCNYGINVLFQLTNDNFVTISSSEWGWVEKL